MTLYQKIKKHNINLAPVGLEQGEENYAYFCTPKGAKIIGWAGVDGIHYCTIRGFGNMIFAVSPSNMPGDYVHPIAYDFEDLLGLLMSCGSMDAIEQAHLWDEAQFDEYVKENHPSERQLTVMNQLKEKFGIEPMNEPFAYIKKLQTEFDYSKIKYSKDYYDLDMNPAAESEPVEWKVTYDGGFWSSRGRKGREIPIEKSFFWGKEHWYIPAVYVCSKGLVIDICMDVDPNELKDYIDKWNLLNEADNVYFKEEREQMEREHPMNARFDGELLVNGKELRRDHGYGVSWIPASCLNDEIRIESEAQSVLEHYGLDRNRGWAIHRCSFGWATKRTPVIKTLELTMKRELVKVPGICFEEPSIGDILSFVHPATGEEHRLEIHEYEAGKLEQRHFPDDDMEYPSYYAAMTYSIQPELTGQNFMISDYHNGDSPRVKNQGLGEFAPIGVSSVTVIGRADGPKLVLRADGKYAKPHVVCSSLYFEQPPKITWCTHFHIKMLKDKKIELM